MWALICWKLSLTYANYINYLWLDQGLIISINTVALENVLFLPKKSQKRAGQYGSIIFRFCANMIVFSEVGGLGAVVECSPIWISLYYCESWCCNISKSALVTCRLQSLPSFGKLTQYAVLTNASQQSYGFNLLVTKYI